MTTAHKRGADFEQRACQFLTAQNLTIITTNYFAHHIGEIDIIALHDIVQKDGNCRPTLVFVEVKARKVSQYATALESVTPTKQRKIIKTAEHFLQLHPDYANYECRFDVIGFKIDERQTIGIDWVQGAFWVA